MTIREFYGDYRYATGPWASPRLGDARPAVLPNPEIAFERVAAARPDVIIGTYSGTTRPEYEKLS